MTDPVAGYEHTFDKIKNGIHVSIPNQIINISHTIQKAIRNNETKKMDIILTIPDDVKDAELITIYTFLTSIKSRNDNLTVTYKYGHFRQKLITSITSKAPTDAVNQIISNFESSGYPEDKYIPTKIRAILSAQDIIDEYFGNGKNEKTPQKYVRGSESNGFLELLCFVNNKLIELGLDNVMKNFYITSFVPPELLPQGVVKLLANEVALKSNESLTSGPFFAFGKDLLDLVNNCMQIRCGNPSGYPDGMIREPRVYVNIIIEEITKRIEQYIVPRLKNIYKDAVGVLSTVEILKISANGNLHFVNRVSNHVDSTKEPQKYINLYVNVSNTPITITTGNQSHLVDPLTTRVVPNHQDVINIHSTEEGFVFVFLITLVRENDEDEDPSPINPAETGPQLWLSYRMGSNKPVHVKARGVHPSYPQRFQVPDDKVSFNVDFPDYKPTEFTHPVVNAESEKAPKGWADPMETGTITDLAKRDSYEYPHYSMDKTTKLPLNPWGRTGMTGRGLLGRFGPNHAADPIVTRVHDGKIQMVAIKRKDTGAWAIPGGMVDAGENVSVTLKREFEEEAGNVPDDEKEAFKKDMDDLFRNGKTVYKGYVDDPRNTDNAWMETVVVHFKCSADLGEKLKLSAGDDASHVKWLDVDENVEDYKNLYASHKEFVNKAVSEQYLDTKK
jgi:ADP-ribose pyrophosphatase